MKPATQKTLIALALAAPLLALPQAARAENGMTVLNPFEEEWAAAYGVSADGKVVVGESWNWNDGGRAFWSDGRGFYNIGVISSQEGEPNLGVSADGAVVVGGSRLTEVTHAFRWTRAGGRTYLGTLGGADSFAYGVSANGTVVVGYADTTDGDRHAFRWVQDANGGVRTNPQMYDLGTLPGGTYSLARGVSADGRVVVGEAELSNEDPRAFRWVESASGGQMVDLGTLGGGASMAYGVSADGKVVVGDSWTTDNRRHAFRWVQGATGNNTTSFDTTGTSGGAMADLGTLGGGYSYARGVSANGAVVVGVAQTDDNQFRAFRWTEIGGMKSVEDWLRASGVTVSEDLATYAAYATNQDGSVVVGQLANNLAFIARVSSGLITLADVQNSLAGTARGGSMALSTAGTLVNGAHGRPLSRRVAAGQNNFWVAGDWGRDDHGSRDGDFGLAEIGVGRNFGPVQVNVAAGQTWAKQNQVLNGQTQVDGTYLLAEALIPVAGKLWGTLGGYVHRGNTDIRRGYLNAGVPTASTGAPDVDTWSLRARLDWDNAYTLIGTGFTPYADLTYSETKLAAYTETGGGFPARFDSRKDRATELRLGVNTVKPLGEGLNLVGTLEAAHRFEKDGARTSGQVIGLFGFDLAGQKNRQDWLRAGIGVEGKLATGIASLSLNATTKGETPSYWLAANWQKAF